MLIPDHLPQFVDKKTLIIVAGSQSADLHIAHESEVTAVAEVRVKNIEHDDQPGQFQRSGHGKTLGTGTAGSDEAPRLKKHFHQELEAALQQIKTGSIQQVILLSSPQDKADTRDHLPKVLADSITLEIDGNFVGEHPKNVIERIEKKKK